MSVGKIGGILAIISGALVLVGVMVLMIGYHVPLTAIFMIGDLILSILVLVGGILGLTGKKWGGILALISGSVWLVNLFLLLAGIWGGIFIVSVFWMIAPSTFIPIIYFGIIEIALAILGGILILVSSSE